MRRLALLVVVAVVLASCTSGEAEFEGEGLDLAGVKAAAIRYVLENSNALSGKDLVYVAGPSLEPWEQWCNFDIGEPDVEVGADNPPACDVLHATSFDLPIVYPAGSDSANEIETALSPVEIEFIEDRESVVEPFGEGMMIAPIQNDAGLLTFGVLIEADGKVYLPVDVHGEGWLFELTPSETDNTGWEITPIAAYIV